MALSKYLKNHPTTIKQPFQETVVSRMRINTCELSRHGQKSAIDQLKSFITHINLIKTISTTYNKTSTQMILQSTITIVRKRPVYFSNRALLLACDFRIGALDIE